MDVFVSYTRTDNSVDRLRVLEEKLKSLGKVYIDDLHFDPGIDRNVSVETALKAASMLVVIVTSNYLKTEWTNKELRVAEERGIPVKALMPDGVLLDIEPSDLRNLNSL